MHLADHIIKEMIAANSTGLPVDPNVIQLESKLNDPKVRSRIERQAAIWAGNDDDIWNDVIELLYKREKEFGSLISFPSHRFISQHRVRS